MTRRFAVLSIVLTIVLSACSNLGLGEAGCAAPATDVSPANILTVQAVPTAKYTPCLNELRLGWDSVTWFARSGEAGFAISRSVSPFLEVTVTEACDVGVATLVDSGFPDIARYEDISSELGAVEIALVPSGELPLQTARSLASRLSGVEIEDRPVSFIINDEVDEPVTFRVNEALASGQYVWIIEALGAEEGTVEVRGNNPRANVSRLSPDDALDLIEDFVPEPHYRGNWFFTFDGGCITYEFNAKGVLAESVAADADDALGFYQAAELRRVARDAGFDI
ncbi:MAG: hypothetical protein GY720_12390 [bacterium]|nr:hypothetical protein [bacterium]